MRFPAGLAASLLRLGLRSGQKVAVHLPNVPQFLFVYFGVLKAGLVLVPLNPLLRSAEIAYHLDNSDAALLVTFDAFAAEAVKGVAEAGDLPIYVVASAGDGGIPDGARLFEELYRAEDTGDIAPMNPDDTAVILYTSGTTGRVAVTT